jgi:glutamyl-tRNA synthetase
MPIHSRLYSAFGFTLPTFAHLPLLVNMDGSKLSKRHADVHVESYREQGFEPEALVNFVALMGYNWHASEEEVQMEEENDTSEVFTMQDMIDKVSKSTLFTRDMLTVCGYQFDPARISQSRATPDIRKLYFLNKQHLLFKIREGSVSQQQDIIARLTQMIEKRWPDENVTGYLGPERVLAMAQLFVGRSETLQGLIQELDHFFETPDWNSEEAQAMMSAIGPAEYGECLLKDTEIAFH